MILLNAITKAAVYNFIAHPSHALLLAGEEGSGQRQVATIIQDKLLGSQTTGAIKLIGDQKRAITIDEIREIREFTKLKTSGSEGLRRLVIIDNAQSMGLEAQNALLKIL